MHRFSMFSFNTCNKITTRRMPNILTTFRVRHTKRHLNYLKLYSHCPENAADSADVFILQYIVKYRSPSEDLPVQAPPRFVLTHIEYPFSIDKARKLRCIEHRVVTCNFSKSIDNSLKFGGKIYFLDFSLFINSEFVVFPHNLIGGSKQCSLKAYCAQCNAYLAYCAQ